MYFYCTSRVLVLKNLNTEKNEEQYTCESPSINTLHILSTTQHLIAGCADNLPLVRQTYHLQAGNFRCHNAIQGWHNSYSTNHWFACQTCKHVDFREAWATQLRSYLLALVYHECFIIRCDNNSGLLAFQWVETEDYQDRYDINYGRNL